jgi:hypothetical protein
VIFNRRYQPRRPTRCTRTIPAHGVRRYVRDAAYWAAMDDFPTVADKAAIWIAINSDGGKS